MDEEKIAALAKATHAAMNEKVVPVFNGLRDLAGVSIKLADRIESLERSREKGFGVVGLEKLTGELFQAVDGFIERKSGALLKRIKQLEEANQQLQISMARMQEQLNCRGGR